MSLSRACRRQAASLPWKLNRPGLCRPMLGFQDLGYDHTYYLILVVLIVPSNHDHTSNKEIWMELPFMCMVAVAANSRHRGILEATWCFPGSPACAFKPLLGDSDPTRCRTCSRTALQRFRGRIPARQLDRRVGKDLSRRCRARSFFSCFSHLLLASTPPSPSFTLDVLTDGWE